MGQWSVAEMARELRRQILERMNDELKPKNTEAWLLLRERWYHASEEQRRLILNAALIPDFLPLEKYSKEQKQTIERTIRALRIWAREDEAFITRFKRILKAVFRGDRKPL
ncbi:hypothetical protein A4G19_08455 [Pasteurellaceae bacterium Macca]|nr:hypothetical protein [Pasteurellaceae bacterium Macca]